MRKLITEEDVRKAKSSGEDIYIDDKTIVTAQARDVARDIDVKIILGEKRSQEESSSTPCDKEIRCCGDTSSCQKETRCCEAVLSPDEIYKLLSFALEAGLVNESDLAKLL